MNKLLLTSLIILLTISCGKKSSSDPAPFTPTTTSNLLSSTIGAGASCLALNLADSLPPANPEEDLKLTSVSMEPFNRGSFIEAKLFATLDPTSIYPDAFYFKACLMSQPSTCEEILSSTPIEYTPTLPPGELNITAQACVFTGRASVRTTPLTLSASYNNINIFCGPAVSNAAVQDPNTGLDQLASDLKDEYNLDRDIFNQGIYLYTLEAQARQLNSNSSSSSSQAELLTAQNNILSMGEAVFADEMVINLPNAVQAVQLAQTSNSSSALALADSSSCAPNTSSSLPQAPPPAVPPPAAPPPSPPVDPNGTSTDTDTSSSMGTGTATDTSTGFQANNPPAFWGGVALAVVGVAVVIGSAVGISKAFKKTSDVVGNKAKRMNDPLTGSSDAKALKGAAASGAGTKTGAKAPDPYVAAQPEPISTSAVKGAYGIGSLDYAHAYISENLRKPDGSIKSATEIKTEINTLITERDATAPARSPDDIAELNKKIDIAKKMYAVSPDKISGGLSDLKASDAVTDIISIKADSQKFMKQVYGSGAIKTDGNINIDASTDVNKNFADQKAARARTSKALDAIQRVNPLKNLDEVVATYDGNPNTKYKVEVNSPREFVEFSDSEMKTLAQARQALISDAPDPAFTGNDKLTKTDGTGILDTAAMNTAKTDFATHVDGFPTANKDFLHKGDLGLPTLNTKMAALNPDRKPVDPAAPGDLLPAEKVTITAADLDTYVKATAFPGGKKVEVAVIDDKITALSKEPAGEADDARATRLKELQMMKDTRSAFYEGDALPAGANPADYKSPADAQAEFTKAYGDNPQLKTMMEAPAGKEFNTEEMAQLKVDPKVEAKPIAVDDPPKEEVKTEGGMFEKLGSVGGLLIGVGMAVGGAVISYESQQNQPQNLALVDAPAAVTPPPAAAPAANLSTINDAINTGVAYIESLMIQRNALDNTISSEL